MQDLILTLIDVSLTKYKIIDTAIIRACQQYTAKENLKTYFLKLLVSFDDSLQHHEKRKTETRFIGNTLLVLLVDH
jgi:hypothetical protein